MVRTFCIIKNLRRRCHAKLYILESDQINFRARRSGKTSGGTQPYGKNVLLVYGGGSIKRSGLYDQVIEQLNKAGATVHELAGVEPNPRVSTVNKGVAICKEQNIDFLLAVGGGSVIDCTKAIAAGAKYDGDAWDIVTKKHQQKMLCHSERY